MVTLESVEQDPGFQKASPQEKAAYLREVVLPADSGYAKASPQEQAQYFEEAVAPRFKLQGGVSNDVEAPPETQAAPVMAPSQVAPMPVAMPEQQAQIASPLEQVGQQLIPQVTALPGQALDLAKQGAQWAYNVPGEINRAAQQDDATLQQRGITANDPSVAGLDLRFLADGLRRDLTNVGNLGGQALDFIGRNVDNSQGMGGYAEQQARQRIQQQPKPYQPIPNNRMFTTDAEAEAFPFRRRLFEDILNPTNRVTFQTAGKAAQAGAQGAKQLFGGVVKNVAREAADNAATDFLTSEGDVKDRLKAAAISAGLTPGLMAGGYGVGRAAGAVKRVRPAVAQALIKRMMNREATTRLPSAQPGARPSVMGADWKLAREPAQHYQAEPTGLEGSLDPVRVRQPKPITRREKAAAIKEQIGGHMAGGEQPASDFLQSAGYQVKRTASDAKGGASVVNLGPQVGSHIIKANETIGGFLRRVAEKKPRVYEVIAAKVEKNGQGQDLDAIRMNQDDNGNLMEGEDSTFALEERRVQQEQARQEQEADQQAVEEANAIQSIATDIDNAKTADEAIAAFDRVDNIPGATDEAAGMLSRRLGKKLESLEKKVVAKRVKAQETPRLVAEPAYRPETQALDHAVTEWQATIKTMDPDSVKGGVMKLQALAERTNKAEFEQSVSKLEEHQLEVLCDRVRCG